MVNKFSSLVVGTGFAILLSACDKTDQQALIPRSSEPEVSEAARVVDSIANLEKKIEVESAEAASTAPDTIPQLEAPILVANIFNKYTASVESLDLNSRVAVLVDEYGNKESITISTDSRNLSNVSAGDTVVAESLEQISVYLAKEMLDDSINSSAEVETRAEAGELPSASRIKNSLEVHTVAEIDTASGSFSLMDNDGSLTQYVAQNPANLSKASVGSRVVIETSVLNSVKVEKAE